jgi:NAD(P)-dependent dehydrogenase (short-subunit alcohol dehydrogenase family)
VGIRRNAAYCASKGGVELLTKVLALEWGPAGVTVNAVAPGFIRTPVNAERLDRPEFLDEVVARVPVARVGTPVDVAAAVLFLASPAASFVNGTSVLVDGGWTAQ